MGFLLAVCRNKYFHCQSSEFILNKAITLGDDQTYKNIPGLADLMGLLSFGTSAGDKVRSKRK